MAIRVLIADDHKIVRQGFIKLLEKEPDLQVVGEAEDGREVIERAASLQPDVIIMDIAMPNLNGIEATRKILAQSPDVKIIGLSMYSNERYVTGMLRAGATGFLVKNCAYEELARAIRAVTHSQTFLSPEITTILVTEFLHSTGLVKGSLEELLTAREREVLQMLAEGETTQTIADQLHVSPETIKAHRRNIMEKLDLHNLADLIRFALREGLTTL